METASLPGDDKRMSNYISRLIARSYNRIETIQPRLPTMFEPHINDALDFHKREVDINPTHYSSKEDKVISTLSDSTKQILSNPVKQKIETGKNDMELHTSSRLQSYKPKDLANSNGNNLETSHESLNVINPDIEYPEKVGDTIIDEVISTLSNSNKQISSNPVKQKIETGKNDTELHTSSRLESYKPKDLTNTNVNNFEISHESLNVINPDTEYPEEVRDTIIDENVSHNIFFKPDNNQTQNTDLPGSPNFIVQLNASRHTLSEQNVSTSGQVSAEQSDSQTLNKLNDQPDSSNSTRDEINYIQQRNEVESNSSSHNNSNIENIIKPVIINQTQPNQNNGQLRESIPKESSFHPFKGKLVAQSRIGRNDNSPIDINDPPQQSVIRVNIGRIEVRAVQPPTPPPQPQSKQFKPILSLDDYLSQRNGG